MRNKLKVGDYIVIERCEFSKVCLQRRWCNGSMAKVFKISEHRRYFLAYFFVNIPNYYNVRCHICSDRSKFRIATDRERFLYLTYGSEALNVNTD